MSLYSVVNAEAQRGGGPGAERLYTITNIVDFAAKTGQTSVNAGAGAVQNDTIDALAIKANTLVLEMGLIVDTVEGSAVHVDLDVKGGHNSILDNASINTLGPVAISTNAVRSLVTSDTVYSLTLEDSHTYNAAKLRIYAVCVDLN